MDMRSLHLLTSLSMGYTAHFDTDAQFLFSNPPLSALLLYCDKIMIIEFNYS